MRFLVRLATLATFVLPAVAAGACGSSADGGGGDTTQPGEDGGPLAHPGMDGGSPTPGTDASMPGSFTPGPHPDFPTLKSMGGPVMTAPKIVPIFFPGYDYRQQVGDYVTKIAGPEGKAYWTATTSEYGVGPLSAGMPVDLTEAAPATIDDAAIQTWLEGKLDGTHPEFGTISDQTIYTIFYPKGTAVTIQGTQACGNGPAGWHETVQVTSNGSKVIVPYAVIPYCATYATLAGVDVATGAVSHEWAEAATDPQSLGLPPSIIRPNPQGKAAFNTVDDAHYAWRLVFHGIENGDMCAQSGQSFYKDPSIGFTVQRTWSNQSWMAGKDPCAPVLDTPFFAAAPDATDDISTLDIITLGNVTTKGIKVPVGQSKTVDVHLWSTGPVGDFKVVALDTTLTQGGAAPNALSFQWDQQDCLMVDGGSSAPVCYTQGTNGDVRKLTVTSKSAAPQGIAASFLLESVLKTPAGQSQRNFWAVTVGQ